MKFEQINEVPKTFHHPPTFKKRFKRSVWMELKILYKSDSIELEQCRTNCLHPSKCDYGVQKVTLLTPQFFIVSFIRIIDSISTLKLSAKMEEVEICYRTFLLRLTKNLGIEKPRYRSRKTIGGFHDGKVSVSIGGQRNI